MKVLHKKQESNMDSEFAKSGLRISKITAGHPGHAYVNKFAWGEDPFEIRMGGVTITCSGHDMEEPGFSISVESNSGTYEMYSKTGKKPEFEHLIQQLIARTVDKGVVSACKSLKFTQA